MKIFEKVKNMFTEEVEDDVKIEQVKGETYKPVEKEKIEKEEVPVENFKFNTEEKVSTPIFFDDNDFRDLNLTKVKEEKVEVKEKEKDKEKEKELYGIKKEKTEEKKNFKPTPIISPVYGVLDKNYYKEDIVSRNEVKSSSSDITESSIDMVRAKAYGTLEDELENTLFGSNSILFKKDDEEKLEVKEVSDDILTDLTDDISKELDELLIKKEKYVDDEDVDDTDNLNDEIKEKNNDDINDDLFNFIDSTLYKNGDEE